MSSDARIDQRTGWPAELCMLLEEYPRASWQRNMTPLAQFWIDKHNDFRGLCAGLKTTVDEFRERPDECAAFAKDVASRTHLLIALLHGHHQVEDLHYFPVFRAADPRLGAGFDVLAGDHELLHENALSVVESIQVLRNVLRGNDQSAFDAQRRAADAYVEAIELMSRRILRHLDDEEDLVIPLMLAHG